MKFILRTLPRAVLLVAALLAAAPSQAQQGGFYYTVQRGDSISVVARRYNMSAAELARTNRLQANASLGQGSRLWIPRPNSQAPVPRPGMRQPQRSSPSSSRPAAPVLRTPAPPSASSSRHVLRTPAPSSSSSSHGNSSGVYVVRPGDSLTRIGGAHGMSAQALANLNGIDINKPLLVGQRLRVSGGGAAPPQQAQAASVVDVPGGGLRMEAPSVPTTSSPSRSIPSTGGRPSASGLIWPTEGRLLRRFANRSDEKYTGIDIAVPKGTEVRAANEGKVVYAGSTIPSYGNMVIVSHSGNVATCYAQLDRILVREGQSVSRGQVVGRSGDSGRGNEAFLHFEVRRNGEAVNPEPMLP